MVIVTSEYMMVDGSFIENLAKQLSDALPPGLKQLHEESLKQFKLILQSQLNKLDLVSREEFDIQVKVMEKLQNRVEELEARLQQLEVGKNIDK
jgi:ubiquinone biosynthesis accessory factor UbiK